MRLRSLIAAILFLPLGAGGGFAQAQDTGASRGPTTKEEELLRRIAQLEERLARLEKRSLGAGVTDNQLPAVAPQTALAVAPETLASPAKAEPFSFADFSWVAGNSRTTETPLATSVFTGEMRVDVNYVHSFHRPEDHTLIGSSELGRTGEIQLQQLGLGGDFHYKNVRGRVMTQFGMYSQMTPRNDTSTARGQWNLDNAYRYLSEAYGGVHFNKMHGINVDAGIFMSYVGLFSYYQFDNWAYQPSYVSSNTPWFFNGVRVQFFPTEKLKIEPWVVNGWQSYGTFNEAPGVGLQVLWRPNGSLSFLVNTYRGQDTLRNPGRKRFHSDSSIVVKYRENVRAFLNRAALSFTLDLGCESGGGVQCAHGNSARPSQYFAGFMVYNRWWLHKDLFGITLGGGAITNPGRYLVLIPPINGATAFSGTPYFTTNPGDSFRAWDASLTFDYMPSPFLTWRMEYNHRAANVAYFAGRGGSTPPAGNTGPAGSVVSGFTPDLRKRENRITFGLLLKL